MQFKVPQFLEIEDKIFGPFTFRQFVYLIGGAGICFILYKLLGVWLGAIPIVIMASFSLALAFYRPNSKPFIYMLESAFLYSFQSKLYIWKKSEIKNPQKNKKPDDIVYQPSNDPRLSNSKLRDLAWSLDVLDLTKNKENQL